MWTPRRVVLLSLGFALFLFSYAVYVRFLGGIDGLPPLPEHYAYGAQPTGDNLPVRPIVDPPQSDVEVRLQMAFGKECNELTYAIKLWARPRGMCLAAKEFRILEDGRVRLSPLSVAMFNKNTPEGKYPEINSLTCNVANLQFDRPIKNPADMSKGRIVAAELIGNVDVINNRRTGNRDDDLTLFTQGPVFYEEAKSLIWTTSAVEIKDMQNRPDPNQVRANGMDLHLSQDAPGRPGAKPKAQAKAPPKKNGQGAFAGVDVVVLKSDVEMHLYVDASSGFLGSGKEPSKDKKPSDKPPAATPAGPPKKSHVVIKTQGPFNYDVVKNHAQFDVSQDPGPFPNRVQVNRFHEQDKLDQLDCERLRIQFVNPDPNAPPAKKSNGDDRSLDLEMEHAHATGKEVVLLSDSEILEAHGNDFFHDAKTRSSILKGEPEMWALKEGNEIHARELRLLEQQKGVQTAVAMGPGRIELLDKATGKRPMKARWRDKLETSKDGVFDLLVFTKDAAFTDEEHNQTLQGDTLKVWLDPPETAKDGKPATPPATGKLAQPQGRRPHHVEAIGKVLAKAPDLYVHDTDRLILWFRDAQPGEALPGSEDRKRNEEKKKAEAPAEAPAAAAPTGPALPPPPTPTPQPEPAKPAEPAADAAKKPAAPTEKKPRPMDLTAKLVQAHVVRAPDGQYELERLWTEGAVHVIQAPAGPDDKGVDIRGKTLKVTRHPNGNVLVVTDDDDLARLRMDKIYIEGPTVTIDQTTNKAWVNGHGRMEMESNANFQGDKLKKTVPVNVYWQKTMYFDGQFAEFHGGVQAQQENALLLCQTMQVFLDREVSLKEGDKGGPPARIRRLIADQGVRVDDKTYQDGQLVKRQQIECPELSVENETGIMEATGPGVVRILQRGAVDVVSAPPPKSPDGRAKPGENEQMKLTRVVYSGRLFADNKNRMARFTQDVEVTHLPTEDIKHEPNIDRLPLGGLYVRCDRLEVYSQKDGEQPNQQMKAMGRAYTQSLDKTGKVTGSAAIITWNEQKQQVIFDSNGSGQATLYREKVKGGPREEMKGQKILYWRNTGEMTGVQVRELKTN
jgi:hypothetical protein